MSEKSSPDLEKLSDIVDINSESLGSNVDPGYEFDYVDIGSIENTEIQWDRVRRIRYANAPSRARRRVRQGDSLFSTVRPNLQSHAFFITNNHPVDCIASTGFAVLRPKIGTDPRFVYHLLLSNQIGAQAEQHAVGSNYPAVNESDLRRFTIPHLRHGEQRKIAEILDTIDESIRSTERLIAKAEKVNNAILYSLLYSHPDSRPASWKILPLDTLVSRVVDGVHATPRYQQAGVPFLTVENLTRSSELSFSPCRYISESDHRAFSRRAHPRPGDVLVSKDGTLGVARVVPEDSPEFSIFVSVAMLRPRANIATAKLIYSFFQSGQFKEQLARQSSGTGLQHIHLSQFREFRLVVPPIEEQRQIFRRISLLNSELARIHGELRKLCSIKQGLMEDLLTGRVRVKVD